MIDKGNGTPAKFLSVFSKHSTASSLNDFRPIALTPTIVKCFERLVLAQLKTGLPPTQDPLRLTSRQSRSAEDSIYMLLHPPGQQQHLCENAGN